MAATGVDVTRFMNSVQLRLPGATVDVIQYELFAVMDDFLKGSNAWQEDIDIEIPANDPAGTKYPIVQSGPSLIDKLLWVFQTPTESNQARGPAVSAAMQIPGELTLRTQPSSPISYRVTVNLTVQDPTTKNGYVTFPAWILGRYRNVLQDGLLGRMMTQPNKPYTNAQMAVWHTRKFISGTSAARIEVERNNTFRQQAWRFPGFVGGSQKGITGWAQPQ
jgi:hypothetical protein